MKTQDLFSIDRTAKKLNEAMEKTFGKKLNLEAFDMPQLEDARNKLRTQIHNARSQSGFNETLENEALTQAQWMLDAINAELAEREEFVADAHTADVSYEDDVEEGPDVGMQMRQEVLSLLDQFEQSMNEIRAYGDINVPKVLSLLAMGKAEAAADEAGYSFTDQDGGEIPGIEDYIMDLQSDFEHLIDSAGATEGQQNEVAPPGDKYERMVKHIKKGYAKDGKLTPKEKSIAYATAWKAKKNESIEGEDMTTLREGEVQQAQSIVSAKTMVDRVGRWIEDLSGMENDTLLTLGDQIRDEMSADMAKNFISQAAPALQQAIETLKQTRDTLAGSVRILTGEEQGAEMIGAEPEVAPEDDVMGEVPPDEMNAEVPDEEVGAEDEFAAAEPAAGGLGDAGRAKRESIEFENSLVKMLAG